MLLHVPQSASTTRGFLGPFEQLYRHVRTRRDWSVNIRRCSQQGGDLWIIFGNRQHLVDLQKLHNHSRYSALKRVSMGLTVSKRPDVYLVFDSQSSCTGNRTQPLLDAYRDLPGVGQWYWSVLWVCQNLQKDLYFWLAGLGWWFWWLWWLKYLIE